MYIFVLKYKIMIKNLTLYLTIVVVIVSSSCNSTSSSSAGAANVDLSLYTTSSVPGTNLKKVTRNHSSGEIYETGYTANGIREGSWTLYYPEAGFIQTISSYENGVFTGPFLEFDDRGRLIKQANYINNKLDGLYGEFRGGRPLKKIMYKEGAINGYVREYNSRGDITKETYYKNNVLDGTMKHFNEDGKVILEYVYKNGKKLSGGIIE